MRGRRAIVTVAAIAAVAAWWTWPSETRRIRARLDALAAAISTPPQEPDVGRMARLASLARGLHPDVAVVLQEGAAPIVGREAVLALATRAIPGLGPMRVTVDNMDAIVDASAGQATAVVLVSTSRLGQDGASAEPPDSHEVQLTLVRVDGEWLVMRVEMPPLLSGSP